MSHVGDYPQPVHVDISSTELCVSSNINGNHSQSYMQSDTEEEPIREAPPAKQEEPREASTIKKEDRDDDPADEMKTNANNQRAPKAEKPPVATEGVQPALVSSRRQLSQMLKSPDFAARVGMKTFTVVPPKPVVKPYREREAPTVSGAIKIDDQGNLILPETANHKPTKSTGAGGSANGSLLRKAKAFWSSAEQELNVEEHKMGAAEPKTCNSQTSVTSGTSALPRDETTQSREFKEELVKPTWDAGKRNTSMYEQPIKPPQTLLLLSDNEIQAEFPFRKPIRRTSSQYIASAIAKCSKVPQSVSEPVQFQAKNVLSSVPEKGKHVSHSPHLENGESNGRLESERHKGPLDELSEKEELGIPVSIIDQWTPQPAGNPEINNATSSFKERVYEGTWKNTQDNSKSENVTGVNTDSDLAECHRSPLQFPTSYLKLNLPPQSRLGPSTSLENMQSNELRAEAAHGLRPTGQSSCLTGPIAKSALKSGSLFGPVRKFRPIHLKPLQKEASLHSSLMEAIQAGEGKERLRKTPDPIKSADHQKPSFVEAEGQRSQLLAAIRAQNGISGLRKISSTASTEISHVKNLENVQNAANGHSPSFPAAEFSHSKEKQVDAIHADAGSNHLKKMTSESLQEHSPLATEGDFPVESCPPPPPPLPNQHSKLSQPRLPSAACANSGAREALMEAIRTGAGAAQLKKVPVPSKTVLVNGRLGTMQASLGS
ncbi:protein cordon-bleu-like [Polypterus senegalus]|uniref:protein cordon-bleu-like n=1 Tax=Polypterus senegalus TaxID=55291 RepID=UPI001965D94D|nr:protein cordon-bleu-like [Polypterus senegalus]